MMTKPNEEEEMKTKLLAAAAALAIASSRCGRGTAGRRSRHLQGSCVDQAQRCDPGNGQLFG